MKNRIRVGVLLFKENKLLLVRHVDPVSKFEFWVPPGGGIEGSESLFETAEREVFEEAGLRISIIKVVYVQQFITQTYGQNNLEVFVLAETISGEESIKNISGKGADEHFIKELRYFSEEEIRSVNVFPKTLQDELWKDKRTGFPNVKFMGVRYDKE